VVQRPRSITCWWCRTPGKPASPRGRRPRSDRHRAHAVLRVPPGWALRIAAAHDGSIKWATTWAIGDSSAAGPGWSPLGTRWSSSPRPLAARRQRRYGSWVTPLPQIVDEARRLMQAACEQGVPIRLVGGLAVRMRADDAFHEGLSREYNDIDLVTLKGKGKVVTQFLESMGYQPHREFNGLNGHERLLFHDLTNRRQLDVFVGVFRMCHQIPIGDRTTIDAVTVPLAELLLTKLQIVRLNEKDLRDVIAIVYHHDVAEHDGDTINAARIAHLCADDWGLWRTCKMNIERAEQGLSQYDIAADERDVVKHRLDALWQRIESEPKSRGWRLRDRIGDRRRWYDEPEEVGA
jgi:hypothetical protein